MRLPRALAFGAFVWMKNRDKRIVQKEDRAKNEKLT
jgi:hypothetical protein